MLSDVTDRMKGFLETDDLLFLMQLSVPSFRVAPGPGPESTPRGT